jgi:hypothetical protein
VKYLIEVAAPVAVQVFHEGERALFIRGGSSSGSINKFNFTQQVMRKDQVDKRRGGHLTLN